MRTTTLIASLRFLARRCVVSSREVKLWGFAKRLSNHPPETPGGIPQLFDFSGRPSPMKAEGPN
jgi:hypothetical protein